MLDRRWDILNNFEHKQKRLFLKKLTAKESINILENLYQFFQKIMDKKEYWKVNPGKMQALSKAHRLFMKVKG